MGDAAHGRDKFIGIKRLDDPASCPGSAGTCLFFVRAFGGQNQDRPVARAIAGAQFFDQTEAIEARHVDIGNNDINFVF